MESVELSREQRPRTTQGAVVEEQRSGVPKNNNQLTDIKPIACVQAVMK